MRLKSITLEGFQSYAERESVTLDGLNLVAVIGPNGAGKTTLLNGIEFALFGKFRGDTINSVISRGAKQAEVTLEFDLNGATYEVRRVKGTTRHEVYVRVRDDESEDGWRVLEEKNPKMADPFLTDLIGMDYQTARTTWLIGQNDFGAFCELQPAPRRAVLTNAFGLNRYAELAEKAEAKLQQAQTKRSEVDVQLGQVTDRKARLEAEVADEELHPLSDEELSTEDGNAEEANEKVSEALAADLGDVDALKARHASAQQNLQELVDGHEREVKRRNEDVNRADRALEQASGLAKKAQESRDQAAAAAWGVQDAAEDMAAAQERAEAIEEELPGLREQATEHSNIISACSARMESAVSQAREVKERIATLRRTAHGHEGECFACGQALSEQRAQDMLTRLQEESTGLKKDHDSAQEQRASAEENRDAAQQKVQKAEAALKEAQRKLQRAQQDHRDAKAAADSLPELDKALAEAQSSEEGARTEVEKVRQTDPPVLDEDRVAELRKEVAQAEEKVTMAKEASNNRQELRNERDRIRARQKRIWAEQQRRERVRNELAELEKPISDLREQFAQVEKDAATYKTLVTAFRPAGIPAMILAGVVEELNDDANDILMDLGGQFGVNVTTQREKATGGVDEKVMIYVTTPEGEIDYSTLSGSERFRCALAIRIALARCIARRTGTPIETIVMDEGWGSLDEEFRKAVQDVLSELSADFSVYTVSHIEEIKASFPTVIEVDKDAGTSRAVVTSH